MRIKLTLILIAFVVLPQFGFAQGDYVLFVESADPSAGTVSPKPGEVHSFNPGKVVTLTATPANGYEFVYWLGAVSDTNKSSTTISMDGARYVMPIFERIEFESGPSVSTLLGGGGSGGLKSSSRFNYSAPSISEPYVGNSGGTVTPFTPNPYIPVPGPEDDPDDPDDPEVPEPISIALFGLGAAGIAMKRKKV